MCDFCLECGKFLSQCEEAKEIRPSYESEFCLEGNPILCENCKSFICDECFEEFPRKKEYNCNGCHVVEFCSEKCHDEHKEECGCCTGW